MPPLRAPWRALALALVLALPGAGAAPRPARAQPPRPVDGVALAGEVLHAGSGAPIEGAAVVLAPPGPGALAPDGGAFVVATRATRTGRDGRYRFDGVPPGAYVLRVRHLGFRPAVVDVEFRGSDSRVSVGLTVATVRLSAVEVEAPAPEPFARRAAAVGAEGAARTSALRARQRAHLSTDVREVTHADLAEAVTLGETDLFRALQRLPGVGTRNVFSAELWTRGARWDQTRVTFDGLPLFNPLHGLGLLSAVSADAVGAAVLHPGVRPARLGEGGAGVLELRSRPGGGDGALRGLGELSVLSARAALDQRVAGGRGAWMLSARRSYLDLVLPLVVPDAEGRFHYHFSELAGRADWRLAPGHALEVSALREQDLITGDIVDVSEGNRSRWGNTAAQATVASSVGGLQARHSVGVSRYQGAVRVVPRDPVLESRYGESPDRPVRVDVSHATVGGSWAPRDGAGVPAAWDAGWALVRQEAAHVGELRAVYVGDPTPRDAVRGGSTLTQLALWGARRFRPAPGLMVEPGVRLEAGGRPRGAGVVRPAPRLTARWSAGQTAVSAAVGRSWQYAQARTSRGTIANNVTTHPVPLWLVAGAEVPALRTDLATLGAERWLGGGWHATANAYARRGAGSLGADPRPVALRAQALTVAGRETAHGVELGLRRIEGRWTVAAGYAYGVARREAAGLRFPAAEDRRHALDATTMLRLTRGLHVGAAFGAASGAPFTAVEEEDPAASEPTLRQLEPNARRMPADASLDLLLDWSGAVRGGRLGLFVQLHNAVGRRNVAGYRGPSYCSAYDRANGTCRPRDQFEEGLPRLPVLGVRLTF